MLRKYNAAAIFHLFYLHISFFLWELAACGGANKLTAVFWYLLHISVCLISSALSFLSDPPLRRRRQHIDFLNKQPQAKSTTTSWRDSPQTFCILCWEKNCFVHSFTLFLQQQQQLLFVVLLEALYHYYYLSQHSFVIMIIVSSINC